MNGWKEEEWMLRDWLESQVTLYLREKDLQDVRNEDGPTQFPIKTGGIAYNKGEED